MRWNPWLSVVSRFFTRLLNRYLATIVLIHPGLEIKFMKHPET